MVGVPRSRGCQICRSIKKGCDLRQPACSRCERLNLSCSYEGRQWTFITTQTSGQARDGPLQTALSSSQPSTISGAEGGLGFTALSLQRTSVVEGLIDSCLDEFMPAKAAYTTHPIGDALHAPLASDLRVLASIPNSTLWTALRAWSCALVGIRRNDTVLLTYGTTLYARSLHTINRELQHATICRSDATLTACYFLSLYEWFRRDASTLVTSQSSDWVSHVTGTCRLVELRRDDNHATSAARSLFASQRQSAITAGIQHRRPVITSDVWRSARSPLLPGCINPRDSLLDVMEQIPALLQRHDSFKQRCIFYSTDRSEQDCTPLLDNGESLLRDCLTVVEALRAWEAQTLGSLTTLAPHIPGSPTTLRDVCKGFGYGFFHTVMYYWAGSLILKGQMWVTFAALSGLRRAGQLPEVRQPLFPSYVNPKDHAEDITTNIAHYFEPESGLWGAQIAAFPLGAALHFFIATEGPLSPSRQRLITTVRTTSKADISLAFLKSAAAETVPAEKRGDAENGQAHAGMATRWFGGPPTAASPDGNFGQSQTLERMP